MNVEILAEKPKFKEIKVVLTVRNKAELLDLWHRFNVNVCEQSKQLSKEYKNRYTIPTTVTPLPSETMPDLVTIWRALDAELRKY